MKDEMPGDSPAALQLINSVSERSGRDSEAADAIGGALKEIPLSDVWNAKLFAYQWGATTRYDHKRTVWIVYDGTRWRDDLTGEVDRRGKATVESLPSLLILGKTPQDLNEHRYKLLAGRQRRQMLTDAQSEWPMPVTAEEFDLNSMLLPLRNGTMDLSTGELREHRAEDMLTKQCPHEFTADAVPAEWLKAVNYWMAGDKTMIAYLRRMVGLFLTGDIGDEAFFMLLGPSATGKGTFVSTLEALLGPDYTFPLDVEWFIKKTGNAPIAIDVHAARGKRLLTVSENGPKDRFDVAKIKRWTGGDALSGKGMRENLSQYLPTHKLLLQTNHAPNFADKTMMRRLKNIGFLAVVPEGDRKQGLKKYLRENELPGILNWALGALPGEEGLHGLADWRVNRLDTPKAVSDRTRELLESQDELREFFEEVCEFDVSFEMSRDEGYIGYRQYCDQNRVRHPLGKKAFIAAMREQENIKEACSGSRRWRGWQGIKLGAGGTVVSAPRPCEKCAIPAVADGRCDKHPRANDGEEGDGLF